MWKILLNTEFLNIFSFKLLHRIFNTVNDFNVPRNQALRRNKWFLLNFRPSTILAHASPVVLHILKRLVNIPRVLLPLFLIQNCSLHCRKLFEDFCVLLIDMCCLPPSNLFVQRPGLIWWNRPVIAFSLILIRSLKEINESFAYSKYFIDLIQKQFVIIVIFYGFACVDHIFLCVKRCLI